MFGSKEEGRHAALAGGLLQCAKRHVDRCHYQADGRKERAVEAKRPRPAFCVHRLSPSARLVLIEKPV